jgi:hypothetical protein
MGEKAQGWLVVELVISCHFSTFANSVSSSILPVVQTVSKFLIMQEDEPLIHF